MKPTGRSIASILALVVLFAVPTARAGVFSTLHPLQTLEPQELNLADSPPPVPTPEIVVPGDTFQISITGFNAAMASAFLLAPITATFGITQTFMVGNQTVTVTSSETLGARTGESVTISASNFVPPGTTIGGSPVTALRLDIGRLEAGENGLDLLTPASDQSTGGAVYYVSGNLSFTPTGYLTNGNMTLSGSEVVNGGGSNLASFGINRFMFISSYSTVPEPATYMLFGIAWLICWQRFRR